MTYRGFLALPLTGSAIGLSVHLDGMRFGLSTMARLIQKLGKTATSAMRPATPCSVAGSGVLYRRDQGPYAGAG